MSGQGNYYGMNYPPPPSDYQSSGPIPQTQNRAGYSAEGEASQRHKHRDSGYDRYEGDNQYPPQQHGAYSQYPPSAAYPSSPPPQNYTQDPYAQHQAGLEPPYSRETRHSPAPGYENAVARYQPPEPEWDDQPREQGYGDRTYPPPGYGGHPPPLSAGYDDGYDSREERRRRHSKNRQSRPDSHYGESGDEDKTRDRKHKFTDRFSEKEKGLGATLLGGAGGAALGHEFGGGALGAIAGLAAGAFGANYLEKNHEKHKKERKHKHEQKYEDESGSTGRHGHGGSAAMGGLYPESAAGGRHRHREHSRSRSRGRRDSSSDSSDSSRSRGGSRRRH